MDPVILTASFTFILYNFFLIHDCVFFKALEAWGLGLGAWSLKLGAWRLALEAFKKFLTAGQV